MAKAWLAQWRQRRASRHAPASDGEATILPARALPGHWWYLAFFAASVVLALWQHGQPWLTLGVLGATPLIGAAVYLPRRWYTPTVRRGAQNLLGLLAVLWIGWRATGAARPGHRARCKGHATNHSRPVACCHDYGG